MSNLCWHLLCFVNLPSRCYLTWHYSCVTQTGQVIKYWDSSLCCHPTLCNRHQEALHGGTQAGDPQIPTPLHHPAFSNWWFPTLCSLHDPPLSGLNSLRSRPRYGETTATQKSVLRRLGKVGERKGAFCWRKQGKFLKVLDVLKEPERTSGRTPASAQPSAKILQ